MNLRTPGLELVLFTSLPPLGLDSAFDLSESSLSFARTVAGEGGSTLAPAPGDGVGGYECTAVSELAVMSVSIELLLDSRPRVDNEGFVIPAEVDIDVGRDVPGAKLCRFGGLTRKSKVSAPST